MGEKVTIGKTRSKTGVRGKRVRGMAGVVRAGQGACVVGCCEGDSKPAHARAAYAAPNSLHEPVGHPPAALGQNMPGRSTGSARSAMSDFISTGCPALLR